jgi:transcriptional regulator of acetoin/glycerol metabolism
MSDPTHTQRGSDYTDVDAFALRDRQHLFVLLDRGQPLAGGARHALANVDRVTLGRGGLRDAQRTVAEGPTLQLRFSDTRMSARHAQMDRRDDGWQIEDTGSTNGLRVNGERVERTALADGDVIELGQTFLRFRAAVPTPADALGDVDSTRFTGLLARFGTLSPRLSRDLDRLARIARSDLSILLEGEPGTGKEVLARAIHDESERRGAFVTVRCADPNAGVVADEAVAAAVSGTLFLDQVGDLPPAAQAAWLRFLLGSGAAEPRIARVVASTNTPLGELVAAGRVQADLGARLAQFTCGLPPLRERAEDLGVLVAAILPRVAAGRAGALSFGASSARRLLERAWPRNVRDLEELLKVGVVLAENGRIAIVEDGRVDDSEDRAGDVATSVHGESEGSVIPGTDRVTTHRSPADLALERDLVAKMTEYHGNVTRVAEAMGKARRQVQRWLARFEIDPDRFRGR